MHSSFVGMSIVMAGLSVPRQIAKRIHAIQVKQAKAVRRLHYLFVTFWVSSSFSYRQIKGCKVSWTVRACRLYSPVLPSSHSLFISQALGVIRLIKMFGYERKIETQIHEKRDTELGFMRQKYHWNVINANYKCVSWLHPRSDPTT